MTPLFEGLKQCYKKFKKSSREMFFFLSGSGHDAGDAVYRL